MRGRIVLASAGGMSDSAVARELGTNRKTVTLWRERFVAGGIESLWEVAPGRGRKPTTGREVAAIVEATLHTKPKGMTHWSCRTMAEARGSASRRSTASGRPRPEAAPQRDLQAVARPALLREADRRGRALPRIRRDKALVLCVDEKSQIQALDRTQPGLPIKKGRCGTMTHDYKRHGTTTLFAALDVLQGSVDRPMLASATGTRSSWLPAPTRSTSSRAEALAASDPRQLRHAQASQGEGLAGAPSALRAALHPDQLDWLNLVERWFGELTCKRIRRGSFVSVPTCKRAIDEFLDAWNEQPKPFVWTATVESICQQTVAMQADPRAHTTRCTLPRTRKARKTLSS